MAAAPFLLARVDRPFDAFEERVRFCGASSGSESDSGSATLLVVALLEDLAAGALRFRLRDGGFGSARWIQSRSAKRSFLNERIC